MVITRCGDRHISESVFRHLLEIWTIFDARAGNKALRLSK